MLLLKDYTPGHISGEKHGLKGYVHPNVHCSTVYKSQDSLSTWMSIKRGMDKEDTVYVYTHSATEKNEIMPFAAT